MKRVLVVDDSEIILAAVSEVLDRAGFAVTTVSDLERLRSVTDGQFDLVLMDVQMPELYGDDVASVLRHERGVTGLIYLFSSLPAEELAARAAEAGLDGYISKNDGIEAMVARVTELLAPGPVTAE